MDQIMGCKVDEEKININETCSCSEDATKENEVESTKSEMTGVREENTRLKTMLQQIEKDYKTLQMRFTNIFQHESSMKTHADHQSNVDDDDQEHELVSLRLGTTTRIEHKKGDNISHVTSTTSTSSSKNDELKLGLMDYNLENESRKDDGFSKKTSPENQSLLTGDQKCQPGKDLKTQRSGDEEFSQTSVKRARVCVRARCDTPTMNDGCQWRKYGQKIAKGNPCPRAYYRCTVSPTCPVRKQVQRCAQDMSILITTYEGTHNHPLPISATAMASTTSAAASMLLSGSTTSQPSTAISPPSTTPYGPTFHPSDYSRSQPYYMHNPSSTPFPTITLDLTTTNAATTHIGGGFSHLYPSTFGSPTKAPATSLSFSSMNSNMVPTVWGNGGFSYGTLPNYNNNQSHQNLQFAGKSFQENKYQPILENFNQGNSSDQQALTETLTKVISSDPSFRSVIAAAISSMASGGHEK